MSLRDVLHIQAFSCGERKQKKSLTTEILEPFDFGMDVHFSANSRL